MKVTERMRVEGRKPYAIPGGGSNPTGALGYVNAAMELVTQANDLGLRLDHVVHATGSAGTQAGLVTGLQGINAGVPLLGIGVRAPKDKQEENVFKLACATADKLGLAGIVKRHHVVANSDYVGEGYGFPAPSTIEAITMLARLEGILLDPVYSGKGMAGLIDLCRKGAFVKGENVVFVHTGGSAALFGYVADFGFEATRRRRPETGGRIASVARVFTGQLHPAGADPRSGDRTRRRGDAIGPPAPLQHRRRRGRRGGAAGAGIRVLCRRPLLPRLRLGRLCHGDGAEGVQACAG